MAAPDSLYGTKMHTPLKSTSLILIAICGFALTAAPALAQSSEAKSRHMARTAAPKVTSQDARHQDCLTFIERHGLSCDPWKEPTCGYDLGFARPLSCVAP